MIIGVVRESKPGETRVAATPTTVGQLRQLGYEVVVEPGAGDRADFPDEAFVDAGATVGDAWKADVVFAINTPAEDELDRMKPGATLIALLAPALKPDIVEVLARRPITAMSMDAVPRISRAQSLDVLSSMANIAGYRAVIEAAHEFGRFFTGQVTAAGKVPPAKVLVVGAGVAGLAAIGAAGALGAIVRATDPRPEVADQIDSLGGEYLAITSPEVEVCTTGYAKEMGEDYKAREAQLYAEQCRDVDIIITTALIPAGRLRASSTRTWWRLDEAGLGDRRHGRRQRGQRCGHRVRAEENRHLERRHDHRLRDLAGLVGRAGEPARRHEPG